MLRDALAAELALFSNPAEFGEVASVRPAVGAAFTITGIPDAIAEPERPTMSTSSRNAFVSGAADVNSTRLHFICAWPDIAGKVKAEDGLTIAAGPFAGSYRIRQIVREGDLAQLRLNKV